MPSNIVSQKNSKGEGAFTQAHLDLPQRFPSAPDFVIAGWVAGNRPLQGVRWVGNPEVNFSLASRPDVAEAYPRCLHSSGFRGIGHQLPTDGKMIFEFLLGGEWIAHEFFQGKSSPDQGAGLARRVGKLERALAELSASLDLVKSKAEVTSMDWHHLQGLRRNAPVSAEPLVSVCIATRNRSELLTRRSLPSILNQTYKNLEVIVVADSCDDDTVAAVERLGDARIQFHQLDRELTPLADPDRRWMVSGSRPGNVALSLAQGDFVTHLDDDDEHMLDRIERLVTFAIRENADFIYHPFFTETGTGEWLINEAADLTRGQVTTAGIFYRNWLKNIPWDVDTHLLGEPTDWNRIRKFVYAGATCVRYPEPLLRHYRERNQALTAVPGPEVRKGSDPVRESKPEGVIKLVGKFDFGLRHDWGQFMHRLEEVYGGGEVSLISGVDWQLMSAQPFPDPWVGVFHQPFSSFNPCVGLFEIKAALEKVEALRSCKGLYVLTRYQQRFLEEADLGVPVDMLWHPTIFDVQPWSPADWLADKSIVFLGRWIRRVEAIQELRCPGVRKLWLAKQNGPMDGVVEDGSVERIGFVDAAAYDLLLTRSVAMTEVIEAAANNVVLECIARSTPLLVNWNSGIVEYLGPDYPLYYSSMAEANWKAASVRQVLAAHEYLLKMDKSRFTPERFVKDFGMSRIYRGLRLQAARSSPLPPSP